MSKIAQGSEIIIKPQKKSFKLSNRNGLVISTQFSSSSPHRSFQDGWKRRSTKKKSFRFHEPATNDWRTAPSSYLINNDFSPSINLVNDFSRSSSSFVSVSLQARQTTDLTDSEILGETIRQNDATLDDLLARANQLEDAVIRKVRCIARISRCTSSLLGIPSNSTVNHSYKSSSTT